jgi:hypothetical protein
MPLHCCAEISCRHGNHGEPEGLRDGLDHIGRPMQQPLVRKLLRGQVPRIRQPASLRDASAPSAGTLHRRRKTEGLASSDHGRSRRPWLLN